MNNTTSFYSTKRNSNVNINNNKVCGYRINNPWMKQGFSYGVKAGRDNGIVDQKLSRFATGQECNEAGQKCAGNTNWLNYKKGMGFTKPESSKTQFSLGNRNNLNAGDVGRYPTNVPDLKPNERKGRGNRLLERVNFMASDIKPRMHFSFDSLRTITYGEEGSISGTTKGLNYKMSVKVPDPTDFDWLREKTRIIGKPPNMRTGRPATGLYRAFQGLGNLREVEALIERELEINPPLGRPQRTTNKMVNSLSTNDIKDPNAALARLTRMVREGRTESYNERMRISREIANVLTSMPDFRTITNNNRDQLLLAIQRLSLPTNYKEYFGANQKQIVGNAWLSQGNNTGLLYMYLLNGIGMDAILKPSTPLYNMYKINRNIWEPKDGKSTFAIDRHFLRLLNDSRPSVRAYVDLHRRSIINRSVAKTILVNSTDAAGNIDISLHSNLSPDESNNIMDPAVKIQSQLPDVYGVRVGATPPNTI